MGPVRVWSACACAKACRDTDGCARAVFEPPDYGESKKLCFLKSASTGTPVNRPNLITVYPFCGECMGGKDS